MLHCALLRAGKLDITYGKSACLRELWKGLASMVVDVRPASTSLRKMRRPRSLGAVRVGTSPAAAVRISLAMFKLQRRHF